MSIRPPQPDPFGATAQVRLQMAQVFAQISEALHRHPTVGGAGRPRRAAGHRTSGFHHVDRAAVNRRRAKNKAARRARRVHRLAARR